MRAARSAKTTSRDLAETSENFRLERRDIFVIRDHYGARFDGFRREMSEWIAARRVKARETIVAGLRNAPSAFIDLLEGRNFGKVVVRVTDISSETN